MDHAQICEIVDALLTAPRDAVDAAIEAALARIGTDLGLDRTYVFRLRPPGRLDNTHEWVADGIEAMFEQFQDIRESEMDPWKPDFLEGRPVVIPDIDALPDTAPIKRYLGSQGIMSLLVAPTLRDGRITGFVGCDAVRDRRDFSALDLATFRSLALAIGAVTDRKAAEDAEQATRARLEEKRIRFEAALSAVPDLVLELDRDGRFVGCQASAWLQPLMPPERFIGRMPENVLPDDLARLARELMADVDRFGYRAGAEYAADNFGGRRQFRVTAVSRTRDGTIEGYAFFIRDITEAIVQQRQIRRLGRVVELTSNMVALIDLDGRIEWVNPAFERRSGWRLDELRGQRASDFLHYEKTDPAATRQLARAMAERRPSRTELQIRSRTGREFWVNMDIQPLTSETGEAEGFVAVLSDITLLKKSFQRELRIRAMALEESTDGMAIVDFDGGFRFMNPAFRTMFGIEAGEDVSLIAWRDLDPDGDATPFRDGNPIMPGTAGRWQGEVTGRSRSGAPVYQDITLTRTGDGGLLCISRDISARRALDRERANLRDELALAQRRETVAHVASGIAHDLNNLVAVVSNTVATLESRCCGRSDIAEGLTRINRAMEAAHQLVGSLGQLDRPPAPRARHDLRKLVREGIDLLGSGRIERHSISASLPDSPCPVFANRTDLLQVILNLAINACEAEGSGPNRVQLSVLPSGTAVPDRSPDAGLAYPNGKCAILVIEDTGTGIDPGLKSRLFDRYVTTKGKKGTGLGLPIVAGILRDNGAALWLDSEPGRGTRVTVAWPDSRPTPRATPSRASRIRAGSLTGHRILVVDDQIEVADFLSDMLEADGAVAIAVSDPTEARSLIVNNPGLWSAVLTDLEMPGLSGIDIATTAAQVAPPVPCVLVSARPEAAGQHGGLFHAVLKKSAAAADLVDTVRAAVVATLARQRPPSN